jgi:hypothetical protein
MKLEIFSPKNVAFSFDKICTITLVFQMKTPFFVGKLAKNRRKIVITTSIPAPKEHQAIKFTVVYEINTLKKVFSRIKGHNGENRVARFFLVHDTKTGINTQNEYKIYQMFMKYPNCS